MSEAVLPVRVYYEDTDAGGIVYYVNYLKFMERARTEWLRELGFDQSNLPVLFVVKGVRVDYRQSARLDDLLQVRSRVVEHRGARIRFGQQIWRQDTLLCDAGVDVVCVDREHLRPCRLPETLVQRLP